MHNYMRGDITGTWQLSFPIAIIYNYIRYNCIIIISATVIAIMIRIACAIIADYNVYHINGL